jgi:hypothetical protein
VTTPRLVTVRANSGTYVRDGEQEPAAVTTLRPNLAEIRGHLIRARREVTAAEKALAALIESLPPGSIG